MGVVSSTNIIMFSFCTHFFSITAHKSMNLPLQKIYLPNLMNFNIHHTRKYIFQIIFLLPLLKKKMWNLFVKSTRHVTIFIPQVAREYGWTSSFDEIYVNSICETKVYELVIFLWFHSSIGWMKNQLLSEDEIKDVNKDY